MFKFLDTLSDKGRGGSPAVSSDSLQKTLITEDQLEKALLIQKKDKKGLMEALSGMGLLSQEELINFSNLKLFAVPSIRISELLIEKGALRLVSRKMAAQHRLIPLRIEKGTLVVAMADPMDIAALEKLRAMTAMPVRPFHAEAQDIMEHIDRMYEADDVMDDFRGSVEEFADTVQVEQELEEPEIRELHTLEAAGASPPMVRMVNSILARAVEKRASDIHIEPYRNTVIIRFRVDGALLDFTRLPRASLPSLISRIKIMGGMDISESRKPQDGKCRFNIAGQDVDFRISTLRMVHGEKAVIRVLNKSAAALTLEQAGFSEKNYQRVIDIINRPYGMFLVTGPTGSGKTTTLYSIIKKIVTGEKNAITVEDPVEYELERVNQVPINPKVDLTFASALRSILRQDPDIIMIGEIRDADTAEIAVQASLTGHYVLSTLHTNDAPGAISRLVDLGIPPFKVAYSVIGAIAQRLVRKICPGCMEHYRLDEAKRTSFSRGFVLPEELWRGHGCEACNYTGYAGRTAIHEVLEMSGAISDLLVTSRNPRRDLYQKALEEHMETLRDDALAKVAAGVTTLEEALTVS